MNIESLEPRIAPAAVVTFFEVDGDKVKVLSSHGTSAQLKTALGLTGNSVSADPTLDFSNLADPEVFQGTDLTITIAKKFGDGIVQFHGINAYDDASNNQIDLGHVTVQGNLGYIDAGDADLTTRAIKSLNVYRMQGEPHTNGIESELHGDVGSILVKGIFHGYFSQHDAATTIHKLVIKGGVGDTYALNSDGRIDVTVIDRLKIGGAVFGGQLSEEDTDYSASITAQQIGHLSIGQIVTGVGSHSGVIEITGMPFVN